MSQFLGLVAVVSRDLSYRLASEYQPGYGDTRAQHMGNTQHILATGIPIGTIVFMSSDSGSAANFRDFEDGFGAYAASKAALNQMLRHMAAELKRKESETIILAMHPGEVATDMANIEGVDWEIEGVMTPEESVTGMLKVIPGKTAEHSGTFWTWEGNQYPW
ncbi:putative short-chain dehydrogenase reductase [Phaeomoniella chlamydospora]|uniref:Putative short-chain dehydrogenase reductase n=1 Tax=Phaeomoniella chlamydospora TaxID=158046 RepID=A0A0G2EH21_PHACM|nr:putative short-chain dehydrogenase reductase [Phaeomoniella chlamydospora]